MVYQAFPYTVLVLYPSLARLDPSLVEAARTLGASPIRAFFNVVVPALRNTLLATLIMVFVFALGSYLLPQLLGRPQHWTLSVLITDQAIYQSNMPFAAAMAIFLVLVSLRWSALSLLIGRKEVDGMRTGWRAGCSSPRSRCSSPRRSIVVAGVSVNEQQTLAFPPVGLLARTGMREIFTDPGWRNALLTSVIDRRAVGGALGHDRLPAGLVPMAAARALGADLRGARADAVHPAAGHHRARLPLLLGDARLLRRSRGRW